MCRVGVSDGGGCSFIAIGPSKDCKWVFNEACTMPWCHVVVHFEVKMTVFEHFFRTIILTVEARLKSRQYFRQGNFQCFTQE